MHKSYTILAVLWTITISTASLINLEGTPTIHIRNLDKLVHLLMYFGFTVLWILALKQRKTAIIAIIAILFGGFIEIIQGAMHQHRSADWLDFLANTIGVLIGLFLIKKIILFLKHFHLYN